MDNEITNRTPQVIAFEINSIKDQAGKMLLYSAIEIGRRLTEAKSLVNHGEWLQWLEESVSYSKSTAENLIRLYEEYGSNLPIDHPDSANSQALGNLSYTQAVLLLGVPKEEREAFIADNDIVSLSTRELQQAVKERDQALSEKADLQNTLNSNSGAINQITVERDELRKQYSSLTSVSKVKEATIKTLQQQLEGAKKNNASTEKIAALEKELKTVRAKVSANKVVFHYDSISKQFSELLKEMANLAPADPETHQKYRSEISEFIGTITKKL
ncbi:Protein of unknown function (DUF3102) [Desulfitobacterium dichloroeliminans LMG P-21439]|uniref:Membrane-bound metallopeptidase n=1 Tax=Desulfitobacterium dichloroeliminans (strain LMG P-21439 / DCA1) TaxID=871963 RepID=L0F5R2_DESDL|nr:DUF3102 domain-containing protein [Desulfitobacterium dichloroeliminans]AGA68298.1 Protein of unknown function (DUF3102) [Desulfitobacterium dichloroeliminans LMG P-21439]